MSRSVVPAPTDDRSSDVHPSVYVADGAVVRGLVRLGAQVSIWYNAVVRAEVECIDIGERTNVQDGCVIHTDPGHPVSIGREVTVGHGAVLHGCSVGSGALVGIDATVLDGATVGDGAIVAAGAVVPAGATVPSRTLAAGVPARVVRHCTPADSARAAASVRHYLDLAGRARSHDD